MGRAEARSTIHETEAQENRDARFRQLAVLCPSKSLDQDEVDANDSWRGLLLTIGPLPRRAGFFLRKRNAIGIYDGRHVFLSFDNSIHQIDYSVHIEASWTLAFVEASSICERRTASRPCAQVSLRGGLVTLSLRSRKTSTILNGSAILLLFLVLSVPADAQVVGATLTGVVTDPSGAPIANVSVTVKNMATGVTRTVPTDSSGIYSAVNLLPGSYEVSITAEGFATSIQSNVTLVVGKVETLNISLKIGDQRQKVVVTDEGPGIELTSATLSAEVNSTTIRELPLNGRDWTQLATLQPGVVALQTQTSTGSAGTNRGNRGFGNQLTDSGHSPYENSYRVNGINTNDYSNGAPGSVIGVNLGVDAIQEFSVLTTDYTAEYGRTSGAVINAITKSGTNEFHGSLYGFLRDQSFDAKNYFDSHTLPIPPFHRNQFGIAAGGPIRKDKTFIFGNYESILQDLSQTFTNQVPSAAARNGTLCSVPILSGPDACTTSQITVSPVITPYLGFWPAGNGPLIGNGDTQTYTYAGLLSLKENYASLRIDHHISDKDSIDGSWFYDNAPQTQPDPLGTVLTQLLSARQTYSAEETHIFSPFLVNTARVGFSRTLGLVGGQDAALNPIANDTSLGSIPGRNAAILTVPGLTGNASTGSASTDTQILNSFQFYDDVVWTLGKHSLKLGFAAEHQQYNFIVRTRANGDFTFGSLEQFLLDTPTSVNLLDPNLSGEIGTRQTLFGAYVQDDWRIRPNLTLNLGLRYEPTTLPTEAHDRFEVLETPTSPTLTPVHTLWAQNQTLKDFSPRVGLAWDPFHDQKTAVRAGFGIFNVLPINWIYTFSTGASAPFAITESATNLQQGDFPIVQSTPLGPSSEQVRYMPPDPPMSYTMNWNLNIEHSITPNLSVRVAYVGSRGLHLPDALDDANYTLPALTPVGYMWPCAPKDASGDCTMSGSKLNPNVGGIRANLWNNSSSYNGLQVGVTKNLSHGLQLSGGYTYQKCMDTGSNPTLSDPFENSLSDYMYFSKSLTRGLCDFNVGQAGVLSYLWNIPTPSGMKEWVSMLVGGWQFGGILTVQSGAPFSLVLGGDPLGRNAGDSGVSFPDRLSGCNPITGNVNGYVNLNCFSPPVAPVSFAAQCNSNQFSGATGAPPAGMVYCANLDGNNGRNSLVGPGLVNLDLSLFKNIPLPKISETFNVQLRLETFNILNHPNFLPPLDNNTIFNADGSPVPGAGLIDATSTNPRQIQVGLRIVW